MRRVGERKQSSSVLVGQGPRLAVMIGMLIIIVMLMQRARDPSTWRFLTGEATGQPQLRVGDQPPAVSLFDQVADRQEQAAVAADTTPADTASGSGEPDADVPPPEQGASPPPVEAAQAQSAPPSRSEPEPLPPLDLDPEQQAAAIEEFSVITDKQALSREDMPAFFRLMEWQQSLSIDEMRTRARRGLMYAQLRQDPEHYRGQLVRLDVRAIRVIEWTPDPNPLGLETVYDVAVSSEDSSPDSFTLATDVLPKGTPLGPGLDLPVTFYGFLLKVVAYEDHRGKKNFGPMLIGKLVIDPDVLASAAPAEAGGESPWWFWLIGGGVTVLVAARFGLMLWANRRPSRPLSGHPAPADDEADVLPLDQWLNRAETGQLPQAISRPAAGETNGNAQPNQLGEGLDRPESQQT